MFPTRRCLIRTLAVTTAASILLGSASTASSSPQPALREETRKTDPCLAWIIDQENRRWDPTLDFGGGHGNTSESYGLPQANPGTKMRSAGPDWATNARTQLRWAWSYARTRYGSTCSAAAYWRSHGYW